MSEVWNSWDLKPPPVCTVKMVLHYKKMSNLKELLFEVVKTLENVDYLHREAAFLSRFLYRYRRQFRHDKGTHLLVMVNQSLKRYLKLNLLETVKTFKQSFPGKLQQAATHAYLPTRQMLKWVLLRFLPFSQLFKRLIELCKAAGDYLYKKMFLGWALNHTLIAYSMTARILTSSKFLLAKSIEWYDCLYKSLADLDSTANFLPEFELPTDLKKWLGEIDIAPPKAKIDEVLQLIDLRGSDSDDEAEAIDKTVIESFLVEKGTEVDSDIEVIERGKGTKRSQSMFEEEDFGVPVDRDEIEEIPAKKFRNNKDKKKKKKKRWNNAQYRNS